MKEHSLGGCVRVSGTRVVRSEGDSPFTSLLTCAFGQAIGAFSPPSSRKSGFQPLRSLEMHCK